MAFAAQLIAVLWSFEPGKRNLAEVPLQHAQALAARGGGASGAVADDLQNGTLPDVALVGERLFSGYNFHLQVVGVLLLVATVGVVVLSKRQLT